ncbi:hypothetical protein AW168_38090 [Nocardia brasiliensis]|uniref:Uncharacterized protein n=2 Tax=Nocardia brasiliensis TaxID=37326 RepID=K0EQS7_NOCB7|nr:hypothetical protein O3I_005985 [Nocardia brasiliensis ATCC 700358]OCF85051.1 hypothetical protein AW168_38090 [Nocardia brasiliensis]
MAGIAYLAQLAAVAAFVASWANFYVTLCWETPWDDWFDVFGMSLPLSVACLVGVGICGLLRHDSAPWVIAVAAVVGAGLMGVIANGGNDTRSTYNGPSIGTGVVFAGVAGATATAAILLRWRAARSEAGQVPVLPERSARFVPPTRTWLVVVLLVGVSAALVTLVVKVALTDVDSYGAQGLGKISWMSLSGGLQTSTLQAVFAGVAAMAVVVIWLGMRSRVQPQPTGFPNIATALTIVTALIAVVPAAVQSTVSITFVADAADSPSGSSDLPDLSVFVIVLYTLVAVEVSAVGLLYCCGALRLYERKPIGWVFVVLASILGLAANFSYFRNPSAYGLSFLPTDSEFPEFRPDPMFAAIAPAVLCLVTLVLAIAVPVGRWLATRKLRPAITNSAH